MTDVAYCEALVEQNHLIGELLRGADWSLPVPTCPGWSLLQLIKHVGRGDRWAAEIIRTRSAEQLDPRLAPEGRPPADEDGAITWLLTGPQVLIEALDAHGPDIPVWTF